MNHPEAKPEEDVTGNLSLALLIHQKSFVTQPWLLREPTSHSMTAPAFPSCIL